MKDENNVSLELFQKALAGFELQDACVYYPFESEYSTFASVSSALTFRLPERFTDKALLVAMIGRVS